MSISTEYTTCAGNFGGSSSALLGGRGSSSSWPAFSRACHLWAMALGPSDAGGCVGTSCSMGHMLAGMVHTSPEQAATQVPVSHEALTSVQGVWETNPCLPAGAVVKQSL